MDFGEIMMCLCWFILDNKCTTHVNDVNKSGDYLCV